ncbi:MAG: tetratricopeptide repeat protein [Saprospiraceae bacterium]|nr:tetratricopeptide repeat protein [Saprospiraceae bacterium]
MSEKLTRKELLELLGKPDGQLPLIDDLDRKALEGYQYIDSDQSAKTALDKLDGRFNKWLDTKDVVKEKKSKTRTIVWIQRVAAVLLLLMIPVFLLIRPNQSVRLANQYFEAPRSTYLMLNRGEGSTSTTSLTEAFTFYEKGDFAQAAKAISEIRDQYPDNKDLQFYQGISLLASGDAEKSISLFRNCLDETYQDLNQRTPWYLALAYLKTGNQTEARNWLEKTVAFDPSHKTSAQQILAKI